MSRSELQRRCVEAKARGELPSTFLCNQTKARLQEALDQIKSPLGDDNRPQLNFGSFFNYQLLARLNLVTIRRILALNRALAELRTDDFFWKQHVNFVIQPRHSDRVITQLAITAPWRSYALCFSPRKATRLYITGHDGEEIIWSPHQKTINSPLFNYQHNNQPVSLTSDHRLIYYYEMEKETEEKAAQVTQFQLDSTHELYLLHGDGSFEYRGKYEASAKLLDRSIVSFATQYNGDWVGIYLDEEGRLWYHYYTYLDDTKQLITHPFPLRNPVEPILRINLAVNQIRNAKLYQLYLIDLKGRVHGITFTKDITGINIMKQELIVVPGFVVDLRSSPKFSGNSDLNNLFILNDQGELYYRGNDNNKKLGKLKNSPIPYQIDKLEQITRIELYEDERVAAITTGDAVYISGQSNRGLLGLGKVRSSQSMTWRKVELEQVVGVSFSDYITAFLLE